MDLYARPRSVYLEVSEEKALLLWHDEYISLRCKFFANSRPRKGKSMYLTQNPRVALLLIVLLVAALLIAGIMAFHAIHPTLGHFLAAGTTPDIVDHGH